MKKFFLILTAVAILAGLAWFTTRVEEKSVKIQAETAIEGQEQINTARQAAEDMNKATQETQKQLDGLGK